MNWEGIESVKRLLKKSKSLFLLIPLVFAGCGGDDRPALAPATGKVTFDGVPLRNAMVVFAPESAQRIATGKTDDAGEFELFTFEPGDGAVIGSHKVSIVAREKPQGETKGGTSMPGGPTAPRQTRATIPKKYLTADTSGLTADVEDGGENYFEFNLEQ